MVLRCPRCSELQFFGRNQVLGELVVCPKCGVAFAWSEASRATAGEREPAATGKDATEARPKRAKR